MPTTMVYSSIKFDYDKQSDCFVADASDLFRMDGRSFYIESVKTKCRRLFLPERREFSQGPDREFVAWHYFSPGQGHRAVIYND